MNFPIPVALTPQKRYLSGLGNRKYHISLDSVLYEGDIFNRSRVTSEKLGEKIRAAREESGLSLQQLGELAGLSDQQLRRVERGRADVTAVVLARIARATGRELEYFLGHVRTVEETAHDLWSRHQLDDKLPGSRNADFKAKRAILESMELWEE